MEAYEILRNVEDGSNDITRDIMIKLLSRAQTLLAQDIKDVPAKIKTELMLEICKFGDITPTIRTFIEIASMEYSTISKEDQKKIDICLRDLLDKYAVEIRDEDNKLTPFSDIIDEYVEFKTNIDNVSPEAAAEVDRMANMTDEEFKAELEKDDDSEETTEEVDTPITLKDFNDLSVAELIAKYGSHDTAKCLCEADGGEEKLKASGDLDLFDTEDQVMLSEEFGTQTDTPNTEYNPEYDIPDEKLYNQED